MKFNKNLKKLKGDASFRIFFRKKKKNSTSIIVYANKDKKLNLLIYDSINKILLKNNIIERIIMNKNSKLTSDIAYVISNKKMWTTYLVKHNL